MGGTESSLTLSQSSIGMADGDISDTMSISSKMGQKGDFDRRQKKKWVFVYYYFTSFNIIALADSLHIISSV